ncbi:hypothetical protein OPAG_06536 [Rhodococcus opacus PD630]|nr:hypothetical protein Pd630_LPD00322 [Rhodococcus opacus PD630]EHI42200.1 hypothetical protein OPAG_06536 [Rhodococcus opacus PD630]
MPKRPGFPSPSGNRSGYAWPGACESLSCRVQSRSSSGAVARYSIYFNVIGTVEPLMGVVLIMICW